jgi:CRISPR-associated endoribonuclease Cas6
VWGSLARRWNTAAPKELGFELSDVEAAAKTALVAEYELRSAMLQMGQSTLKGFVGRVRYELRGTPEQRRVLAGLADAAFYLGVGAKTARGMGLCRRVVERGQR